MHVLYVVNDLGYFRAHRERLAHDMMAIGYQITVAAGNMASVDMTGWNEEIRLIPLELDKHHLRPWKDLNLILTLRKHIRTINPDIVHCFTIKPILFGGLAFAASGSMKKKTAMIWTFAGLGKVFERPKSLWKRIRRKLVATVLGKVATSNTAWATFENEADRIVMIEREVIPANRAVALLGTGVDLEHFSHKLPNSPKKSRHTMKSDRTTFLMATRLIGEKGVDTYLAAAKQLKESGVEASCKLAGLVDETNPDAVSIDTLKAADEAGEIDYIGAVSQADIPALFRSVDVFCMPTRLREGFPRSLLEAASCGVAMIATDQPPMRILVPNEQTGWLIDPPQTEELVAAMLEAANELQTTRIKGDNARKLVESISVDAASIAREFTAIYASALETVRSD